MTEPTNKKMLEMIQTYADVFGSPGGKQVLADIRKSFGGPCFDPNPFVTAYNEGARSVILKIEMLVNRSKNKEFVAQLKKEEEE